MDSNPLQTLQYLGQSVWLDVIQRRMVEEGELQRLINDVGVSGVTSNPTILEKAIAEHDDYDKAIMTLSSHFTEPEALYEALVLQDIRTAADLLRPVFERTALRDGYVSLEVSPELAYDTRATVTEAKRLWAAIDRPNVMIKIPSTREGLPAIKTLLTEGVNINATLIFSPARYYEVARTFIEGLEDRVAAGLPVNRIASVASFFVSRIDTKIDQRLDSYGQNKPGCRRAAQNLRGQAAIAAARLAYQAFRQLTHNTRWTDLERLGARSQRLLWASTSTKDPASSDVKYVEALIGPETVNTLPPQTLAAYQDHGRPAVRVEDDLVGAKRVLERLGGLGIEFGDMATQLEQEGVEKFRVSFRQLLASLDRRRRELVA